MTTDGKVTTLSSSEVAAIDQACGGDSSFVSSPPLQKWNVGVVLLAMTEETAADWCNRAVLEPKGGGL